jgi:hypothetical protein
MGFRLRDMTGSEASGLRVDRWALIGRQHPPRVALNVPQLHPMEAADLHFAYRRWSPACSGYLDTVVVIADGATITSSTIPRLVQQIVPSVKPAALRGTDRYRTWRCRRGLEFDDRARESRCSRTATSENPRSRNRRHNRSCLGPSLFAGAIATGVSVGWVRHARRPKPGGGCLFGPMGVSSKA